MNKRFLIFGILSVFLILALSGFASAYNDYRGGYGGYDRYNRYDDNRYGYNSDYRGYGGYYGYSDTYYKRTEYTPYGKTITIKKDSPYKSHFSQTSYHYSGGYGSYGYPTYNSLYRYFSRPTYYNYGYQGYGYGGYGGYGGCRSYYC